MVLLPLEEAGGLPEQFERTIDVNLMGVWRTDRAVIAEIKRRRGYLLNIASLSAIAHAPLMGAYTTAKSGVEALSDALRMETAPSGARVGCAYFGFIDTDLTANLGEEGREQIVRRSALRRLAEVEDVAAMVEFLLGDGGRNITGAVMTIDAGNTA